MATTPFSNSELKVETETTPDEILVRCLGKMTITSAAALQTAIRELIPQTKRLVLDLGGVSYLDSFGLGALVGVYLSARGQQCQLRLINGSPQVKDLLRITNLASVLQ